MVDGARFSCLTECCAYEKHVCVHTTNEYVICNWRKNKLCMCLCIMKWIELEAAIKQMCTRHESFGRGKTYWKWQIAQWIARSKWWIIYFSARRIQLQQHQHINVQLFLLLLDRAISRSTLPFAQGSRVCRASTSGTCMCLYDCAHMPAAGWLWLNIIGINACMHAKQTAAGQTLRN